MGLVLFSHNEKLLGSEKYLGCFGQKAFPKNETILENPPLSLFAPKIAHHTLFPKTTPAHSL
jgi:hypothetical protein